MKKQQATKKNKCWVEDCDFPAMDGCDLCEQHTRSECGNHVYRGRRENKCWLKDCSVERLKGSRFCYRHTMSECGKTEVSEVCCDFCFTSIAHCSDEVKKSGLCDFCAECVEFAKAKKEAELTWNKPNHANNAW